MTKRWTYLGGDVWRSGDDRHPPLTQFANPLLEPFANTSIQKVALGNAKTTALLGIDSSPKINPEESIIVGDPTMPSGQWRGITENDWRWQSDAAYDPNAYGRFDAAHDVGPLTMDGRTSWPITTGPEMHDGGTFSDGTKLWDGDRPNHPAAIVRPDDSSTPTDIVTDETQPYMSSTLLDKVTTARDAATLTGHSLYGDGTHFGSRGGSGTSALLGVIRVGEWATAIAADASFPHPLMMTIRLALYGRGTPQGESAGHVWPANQADAYWDTGGDARQYGSEADTLGKVLPSGAGMGMLLALPTTVDVDATYTHVAARVLAYTLQTYGAYVLDDSGTADTVNVGHEWSHRGRAIDEFATETGHDFRTRSTDTGTHGTFWTELQDVLSKLHVVQDNGPSTIGGAGTRLAAEQPALMAVADVMSTGFGD